MGDDGVEAVLIVFCYRPAHVLLDGFRDVFHQGGMAGAEYQAVVKDDEDSPWFFLPGVRVYAAGRNPETFLGSNFRQTREAGKGRVRANVLALQGGRARYTSKM